MRNQIIYRKSSKDEILRNNNPIKKIDAGRLLRMVNDVRASGCICKDPKEGISTIMPSVHLLTWSDKIANFAERRAKDMSLNESMFHFVNGYGIDVGIYMEKNHYKPMVLTENTAKVYNNEVAVFHYWLNNYEDCKNLMDPRVREMGAGRAGESVFYWSQIFGSERMDLISEKSSSRERKFSNPIF